MEWPPKSGKKQQFVEVDRAQWFPMDVARRKIWPGQAPFLDRLIDALAKK
jgi:predicted NUDIX family NTP pyrophosphohydrolase